MRWSMQCCSKLASYADERLLFEDGVVALVDWACLLAAEMRLLVAADEGGTFVRVTVAGLGVCAGSGY